MSIKNINENYQFDMLYSNQMTHKQILDFINLKNNVLGGNFSVADFDVKYQANPFGESVIILVYNNLECVGCRAFWRNDLHNSVGTIKAFQPCDTAVQRKHRGNGLFTLMSELGLKYLGNNTVMYNFPNDNSLQGNYKMGWKLISHLKYSIFQFKKHISLLEYIEDSYIDWLSKSKDNQKLFYMKRKGKYLLLKKRRKNLYVVISLLKEENLKNLKLNKANFPICIIYTKEGKIGRGLMTVGRNLEHNENIPFYKMDTLF